MAYLGTPCLLADLVTKPSRSLTRQSYDAKERLTGHGYLNGDGFGIGWYSTDARSAGDPTPCVFSSVQPAWNNQNLERLANKIISPLIFAHVRAAYPGIAVNDSNCQVAIQDQDPPVSALTVYLLGPFLYCKAMSKIKDQCCTKFPGVPAASSSLSGLSQV